MKIKELPKHLKYKKTDLNSSKRLAKLNLKTNLNMGKQEYSDLFLKGKSTENSINDKLKLTNFSKLRTKRSRDYKISSKSTTGLFTKKGKINNLAGFLDIDPLNSSKRKKNSNIKKSNDPSDKHPSKKPQFFDKKSLKSDPEFLLDNLCNHRVLNRIIRRENLQSALLLTELPQQKEKPTARRRAKSNVVLKKNLRRNQFKKKFQNIDKSPKENTKRMNSMKPFKLSEIQFNRGLKNYHYMEKVFKKNEQHFKVTNKIEEINYKQLMEIKLYAQNMIYKKLFEEFTKDIKRQKKHAQMINIVKNNEIRAMRLKRKNISELKKVTKFVSKKISKQRLKVDELIDEFKEKFQISDKERDQIMESFNPTF